MQWHYHAESLSTHQGASMPAILEAQSSLTERYQTTVPEPVRRRLKLGKRDKILYTIRPDGDVVLSRVQPVEVQDPVVEHFLAFLARDMTTHPESLKWVDAGLVDRIQAFTRGVTVDLDAPLPDEDE
jgi:antitoxin PrlF